MLLQGVYSYSLVEEGGCASRPRARRQPTSFLTAKYQQPYNSSTAVPYLHPVLRLTSLLGKRAWRQQSHQRFPKQPGGREKKKIERSPSLLQDCHMIPPPGCVKQLAHIRATSSPQQRNTPQSTKAGDSLLFHTTGRCWMWHCGGTNVNQANRTAPLSPLPRHTPIPARTDCSTKLFTSKAHATTRTQQQNSRRACTCMSRASKLSPKRSKSLGAGGRQEGHETEKVVSVQHRPQKKR